MVEYELRFPDGRVFNCIVDPERSRPREAPDSAAWTRLEFHQCRACPLKADEHPSCPLALDLQDVVTSFRSIPSTVSVEAVVKTDERWYFKRVPVETALQALLGLINATSECPILSRLKGLATFHLPFASTEETFFRSVSLYLLKQYFIHAEGGAPDLELKGLYRLYETLSSVNQDFLERLKAAAESDSTLNAFVHFLDHSKSVGYTLETFLDEFRKQLTDISMPSAS